MPSSTQNVKIGACTVTFKGVDLGLTKGGVEVEVTTDTYSVQVDQFGGTDIKELIVGRNATATTPLAESTIDTLVSILPGSVKKTDATTPSKVKLTLNTGSGIDLFDLADKLVLHPMNVTGVNDDVTFPRAATPGSFSFSFQHDSERVFEATWKAYPDLVTKELIIFGDTTVV